MHPAVRPEEKLDQILCNRTTQHICLKNDGGGLVAGIHAVSLSKAPQSQIAPDAESSGEYTWIPTPDEQVAPCRRTTANQTRVNVMESSIFGRSKGTIVTGNDDKNI